MLKRETLFIVGAGASKELNLPLGDELVQKIIDRIDFMNPGGGLKSVNESFYYQVQTLNKSKGWGKGELANIAPVVRRGLKHAKSIDNFVRTHEHNEKLVTLCKLAIVDQINLAEQASYLNSDGRIKEIQNLLPIWLPILSKLLFADVALDKLGSELNKLKIICFNYDRCIEKYLTTAIQDYFLIEQGEAEKHVSSIGIVHPYGDLGRLTGTNATPFATATNEFDAFKHYDNIKTFGEGVHDESIAQKIHDLVGAAKTIVFLGFGYLAQNMELLKPKQHALIGARPNCYATAYKQSDANIAQIMSAIAELVPRKGIALWEPRPIKSDNTCANLLLAYSGEIFGF